MINKKKYLLILLFLLIIAIPVSFASDNSTDKVVGNDVEVANDTLTISDDEEILGAGDVYFDASATSNGDGTQSKPYNTVTSSNLGTTNHFEPGTYRISSSISSLTSYDGMSFIGQNKDTTILQYIGSDTFIKTSNSITFNGITIKGGSIQTSGGTLTATDTIFDSGKAVEETESDNYKYGNSYGGAIKQAASTGLDWGSIFGGGSSSGQVMNFNNCIFRNNYADYGGAIYSEKGTITITNSRFENNHADNGGGAIAALNGATLTIKNCEFVRDYSGFDAGGAIYLFNVSSASVQSTIFNNCSASIGGAIASLISTVTITESNFTENKANWTGGAVFAMYGSLTSISSNYYQNTAYNGGGIYADNLTSFEVNGGIFKNNQAASSAGAIFAFTNKVNRITNPTYISNRANYKDNLYQTDRIELVLGNDEYEMIQYRPSYNGGALPSKYDLRTLNGVTPVKDQGQSGNCWSFATMATLESAILKATGKQVILSEGNLKNLANIYSDIGWKYETNGGGMYPFAFGYLTSWAGPVLASLDPTDDWDVIAPIINSAFHVQNILFLQRTSYTDNSAIKKAIMDYGAVCSEIYWSNTYLNGNNYYCSGGESRNHAISVVGWDDTKSISGAPGVGAWIIKNSYGSHRGDGGYYYVSYYDKTLFRVYDESYNSFAVVFNDTVRFNKNYQYDVAFTDYFLTPAMNKVMWYKNTFTSTGNDVLQAFSTYFRKLTDWQAEIFVNGESKLNQTGQSNPGYYTINLNEQIPLKTGDNFTISLMISCTSSADIPISEFGPDYTLVKEYFKPGVSFFSTDGVSWTDFYGYHSTFGSGETGHNYFNQVACLKAFTSSSYDDSRDTAIQIVSVNSTNIVVKVLDKRGGAINTGNVEFIIDNVKYTTSISNYIAEYSIDLTPGTHNIQVNYLENEYYNSSTISKTVVISNQNYNVELTIYDANYPSNTTITRIGDYTANIVYNIVKNGDGFSDESLDVVVNGVSIGSTTPNSSNRLGNIVIDEDNEWNLTVVYTARVNGNLISATSNVLKFITKNTSNFSADPSGEGDVPTPQPGEVQVIIRDADYPNNGVIYVNGKYTVLLEYYVSLPSGSLLSSELVIYCNGQRVTSLNPVDKTFTNIGGTIPLNELGDYVFTAVYSYYVFMGEIGEKTSNSITYHITDKMPETKQTLTISVEDVSYPNQATAIVKSNVDGEYIISIGDETFEVNVTNGIGITSFALPANNYTANVVSKSNSSFGNSTTFTVYPKEKLTPNIQSAEEINGSKVIITISLPEKINNENVTVILDGIAVKHATVNNGMAKVEFGNLTEGNYSYTVIYEGNEDFNFKNITGLFVIKDLTDMANDTVIKQTLTIFIGDVVYPNQLTAVVKSNVDGAYVILIGESSYNVTVENGSGNVSFTLPANNYVANVVSKSNSSFGNSTTFTVYPKGKLIPDMKSGEMVNESIVLISIELSKDIDGENVTVILDGIAVKHATVNNGIAEVEFSDLTKRDYSYTVIYEGNEVYVSKNITKSFTIKESYPVTNATGNSSGNGSDSNNNQSGFAGPTIDASDLTRGYASSYDFKATFYDKNGNVLKNSEVNFIINGNDNFVKTDEYGIARLANKLSVGTYTVEINNYATGEVLIRNITIVNRISGNKNINVDYSYSTNYKIRLYADNGQVVGAGELVTITLNNVKYTVRTDKDGYATLKINGLLPKTYTVTAEYKGVKVSNKVVVKQVLKAKNTKFKKSKKIKRFQATLKTSSGKAISGKKVTLKVNGKTYAAKTNKRGVVTFKIKNLKKSGKFKATVSYLKTSIKKTITVKK